VGPSQQRAVSSFTKAQALSGTAPNHCSTVYSKALDPHGPRSPTITHSCPMVVKMFLSTPHTHTHTHTHTLTHIHARTHTHTHTHTPAHTHTHTHTYTHSLTHIHTHTL